MKHASESLTSNERVSFHRPADLPGVEVLRADDCTRRWVWFHTAYSVCTVLRFQGFAEYVYRGRVRTSGPTHQPIMEPGELHTSRAQTAQATFRVLFIPPQLLMNAANELGVPLKSQRFPDDPVDHPPLLRKFRKLHAALESSVSSALERETRFAACLGGLLELVAPRAPRATAELALARVRRAQEYIQANVQSRVSLSDLADLSGLSKFHLAREFTQVAGVPPHAYLLLLRVERARRLLREGASATQAAALAGFVDPSHMTRHFKRVTGVTPGVYAGTALRENPKFVQPGTPNVRYLSDTLGRAAFA